MADEHNTAEEVVIDEPVIFDAKQQDKVNELIQRAMGKAAKETKADLERAKVELTTAQTELAAAKAAATKVKTPAEKAEAMDDVAALAAQLAETKAVVNSLKSESDRWQREAKAKADEVETARRETMNFKRTSAMQTAIGKLPFVNTDVISKLTVDNVIVDPDNVGKFLVLNDDGSPRLSNTLEPMSLDEFYTDFASKNKYLVRGDILAGTGASESQRGVSGSRIDVKDIFGPKSNARMANDLAKSNPAEYRRMKEVARAAGLVG